MAYRNVQQTIHSYTELLTVAELYRLHSNNKFFYDRERLQRLLNEWIGWKKSSYLTSLLNGGNLKDLFQIAKIEPIVEYLEKQLVPNEKNYEFIKENLEYFRNLSEQGYEFIVLDGQHRISTIAKYIEGNFDFSPVTVIELRDENEPGSIYVKGPFTKMPEEAQQFFLNQHVVVTTYTTGDLRELAQIFITSNDMEPMTSHERRILNYNPVNRWLNDLFLHDINIRHMFENIGGMTGEYHLNHKGDTLVGAEMLRYISKNDYEGYNHADLEKLLNSYPKITVTASDQKITAQIFRLMADGCVKYPVPKLKKFTRPSLYNLFYTISFLVQKNNKWSKPFGFDGRYKIVDAQAFVKWFFDKEFERLNAKGTWITFPVPGKSKPKRQKNDWSFSKHNGDQKHSSKTSIKGTGGSKYTFNDWARVQYLVNDLNEDIAILENRGIIQKLGSRTGDITRDEALVAARIPLSEAHKYHVDEIVPVAKGGFRNEDNVQVLTSKQNRAKSAREVACEKE